MAKSINSLLFLFLLSALLLFKIFDFTQRPDHLSSSPNRFYNYVAVNLQLLMPKMDNSSDGDYVFAAANPKTLPPVLPALINKEDMVTLTEKNFSSFMAKNGRVMVIFHRYWWSMAPDYVALVMKLMGAEVVAEVDIMKERALADKFGIIGYYTRIYLFPGGTDRRYKYYSEWDIRAVNSMKPEEGVFRGKFIRRSAAEGLVKNNHDDDQ